MRNQRSSHLQHHYHRRPHDAEEALSSMLWTPYERPTSDSSSNDENDTSDSGHGFAKSKSIHDYRQLQRVPSRGLLTGDLCLPSTRTLAVYAYDNVAYDTCCLADDKIYDTWDISSAINNTSVPSVNNNEIYEDPDGVKICGDQQLPVFASVSYRRTSGCHRNYCQKPPHVISYQSNTNRFSYPHFHPSFSSLTKWCLNYTTTTTIQTRTISSFCDSNRPDTSSSLLSTISLSMMSSSLPSMSVPQKAEPNYERSDRNPPSYESLFVQPRKQGPYLHLIRPVRKTLRRTTNSLRIPCQGQHLLMNPMARASSLTTKRAGSGRLTTATSSPPIMRTAIVNEVSIQTILHVYGSVVLWVSDRVDDRHEFVSLRSLLQHIPIIATYIHLHAYRPVCTIA